MKILSVEQIEKVQGGNPVVIVAAIGAVASVGMHAINAFTCYNGGSASFSFGAFGGSCKN